MDANRIVIAETSIGEFIETLKDIGDKYGYDTPLIFARDNFWGGQLKRVYFQAEPYNGEAERLLEESVDEE